MAHVQVGLTGQGTGPVGSPVTLEDVGGEFRSVLVNDTDSTITVTRIFSPTTGDDVVDNLRVQAKSYVVVDHGAAGTVAISAVATTHGTEAQLDEYVYLMVG